MALFEKAWFWKKVVVYIDRCFFLDDHLEPFCLLLVSGERCHLKEITKYLPRFVYHCPSPPFVHAFPKGLLSVDTARMPSLCGVGGWCPRGQVNVNCAQSSDWAPSAKALRMSLMKRRMGKSVERRVVTGFQKSRLLVHVKYVAWRWVALFCGHFYWTPWLLEKEGAVAVPTFLDSRCPVDLPMRSEEPSTKNSIYIYKIICIDSLIYVYNCIIPENWYQKHGIIGTTQPGWCDVVLKSCRTLTLYTVDVS